MMRLLLLVLLCHCLCHNVQAIRPIAIVTGGTRGIGSGMATCLAQDGYDLLLTYNSNHEAAQAFVQQLHTRVPECRVAIVGGDVALPETRQQIWKCLEEEFPNTAPLKALVHNAGQYVGITAENSAGLTQETSARVVFGDGSLLKNDSTSSSSSSTNFDTMHYYQKLYGEAFIDLCEHCIPRMKQHGGGSIIGTSSPGVTAAYYRPQVGYSMPGSGKSLMEYSMRIYALQVARHNINVNVIVPGVVQTDAWEKVAQAQGLQNAQQLMERIRNKNNSNNNNNNPPPPSILQPRDIGHLAAFLCSEKGRFITGTVIPCDRGLHLQR